MKEDPDLHIVVIYPDNAAGVTPGTYVLLADLEEWLKNRGKVKTAASLSKQALDGRQTNTKFASVQRAIRTVRNGD